MNRRNQINCGGCICGTAIVAILIAVTALILAVVAINVTGNFTSQKLYTSSGEIGSTAAQIALGSAGPLTMTLPNNLKAFKGKRYTINAISAQPHVVNIESGTLSTTFDGTNTIATFGGAAGDGLTFVVIDNGLMRVESSTNVAFSV